MYHLQHMQIVKCADNLRKLCFSTADLSGEKRSSEDDGTADNSVKRQKLAGSQNNYKRVNQLSAYSPQPQAQFGNVESYNGR